MNYCTLVKSPSRQEREGEGNVEATRTQTINQLPNLPWALSGQVHASIHLLEYLWSLDFQDLFSLNTLVPQA